MALFQAIEADDVDAMALVLYPPLGINRTFGKLGVTSGKVEPNSTGIGSGFRVENETPLAYALARTSWRIAEELLRRGADPNARNAKGETPLEMLWAEASSLPLHSSTARALVRAGTDLHIDNDAPLFYATISGDRKLVQLLLKHGASARKLDPNGHSVLDYMAINWGGLNANDTKKLRHLLMAHGAKPTRPKDVKWGVSPRWVGLSPGGVPSNARPPIKPLPPYFGFSNAP